MSPTESAGLPPVPPIGVKVATNLETTRPVFEHEHDGLTRRQSNGKSALWWFPMKRRPRRSSGACKASSEIGIDKRIPLADYVDIIGERWMRGLDPTSTADGYKIGLRIRVSPALGHLPVSQITAGMVDRTMGQVGEHVTPPRPSRTRSRRSCGSSMKLSVTI